MPLLTYVANPATILTNPAVEVIKSIPASWDETVVLPDSEIGKAAVFARRSGDIWFLAAVNGHEARSPRIPLSFLPGGVRSAVLVRDAPGTGVDDSKVRLLTSTAATNDLAALKIERLKFKRTDSLKIHLPPGGGFVARFDK
jgi:alpha-glucosidase